jgi:uncharacterized protein
MDNLESILHNFTKMDGVKTAVVISRDGFVIHGVSNNGLDTEAVAAVISGGIGNSEAVGQDLAIGAFHQAMVEYENGMIVVNLLGHAAALAVVTSEKACLGHVRYQMKKYAPEIERAL